MFTGLLCVFQVWDGRQDAAWISGSNVGRSYAAVAMRKMDVPKIQTNIGRDSVALWLVWVAESIRTPKP